jgi:Arylsulfotransferase (ASST)/Secretion system C-terminal sorting domain/Bacterial Ig-like domain
MKYLIKVIIFITHLTFLSFSTYSQIISTSPISDSKNHNPETSIILKFESPIGISEVKTWNIIIEGTESGLVNSNLKLSSDRKNLIITPKSDFLFNETVFVKINPIRNNNNNNNKIQDYYTEFNFDIRSQKQSPIKTYPDIKNELKNSTDYFPPVTINVNNNPAKGKIFFHNISTYSTENDRFYAIMNNDGTPFFAEQDNDKGLNFTLQKNGYLTFWNSKNFFVMDSTYNVIDTIGCVGGYEADWHEFQLLENGHAFLIAWDVQIVDMSVIAPGGQVYASVEGFVIQELDEDENLVFQWRSWDHFDILDAVDVDFTSSYVSYTHGNALEIDNDGNILVSSRLMNEITKIDRTTGDIIWHLGGKNNEFTFIGDDGFCRQHDIRRIANGNITLFDNGSCHDPQISKAKEYNLDETSKTATLVWEYEHPKEIYGETMGNVQRLSNGNTFINWGHITDTTTAETLLSTITEVQSDKTIVYELTFDTYFHLIYRSFRFEWDVAPPTSTEDNINEINGEIKLFPIPTKNLLNISLYSNKEENYNISIFNSSGINIKTFKRDIYNSGETIIQIDTNQFTEGIYFCKVSSGSFSETMKFIIIK